MCVNNKSHLTPARVKQQWVHATLANKQIGHRLIYWKIIRKKKIIHIRNKCYKESFIPIIDEIKEICLL